MTTIVFLYIRKKTLTYIYLKLITKQIQCIIIILLATLPVNAQMCEWLEVGGGNGTDISYTVDVDKSNNVLIAGSFDSSFTINLVNFVHNSGGYLGFLIKYDAQGNIIWGKTTSITSTSGSCSFYSVMADGNNNIYVGGTFNGTVDFGNSVTLTSGGSGNNSLLVKYDSSGKALWARKLYSNVVLSNCVLEVDNRNNITLGLSFISQLFISGSSQTLTSNGSYDIAIVKYNSAGNFVRAEKIGTSAIETLADLGHDQYDNLYVLGFSASTLTFGSQNLTDTGEIILKYDSAFNPIKGRKTFLHCQVGTSVGIAVRENGDCIVTARFFDTVNSGVAVLASKWSNPSSPYCESSIVYYNANLVPQWAKQSQTASTNSHSNPSGGVCVSKGNIYFGGFLDYGAIRFGSSVLNYVGSSYKFYVVKMDTLGNFLWAFASNDTSSASQMSRTVADLTGNVLITGIFTNKVTVFNKAKTGTPNTRYDFFTAKISDYTITRGFVSSGPYCAGDTLKIPYTKQGNFNIGNKFIAELSDSAGNFEGTQRELGKITDTASGIINGLLPLFNIASNNKYRIRIISTSPVVQSFYKLDSLRLLIYSKDTANAGHDTTICSGQPIRLSTTGGSRWNWWPTTGFINVKDTSNRQPLVSPLTTTEYRIIISDSSGCGQIDTDYVVINVRPYITASIQGSNIICKGTQQKLVGKATGGDSTKYWYAWRQLADTTIISSTDFAFVQPTKNTTYTLTVGDSCSDKTSTANFIVTVDTVLKVYKSTDTTICKGKPATIKAWGSGCDTSKYRFAWYKFGDTTLLGSADSLQVTPTTTTQYKVVLRDISSALADSALVKITVDNVFKTLITKDTTICIGQTVLLAANTITCDTSQIEHNWDNGLGEGATKTVSPVVTTTYRTISKNLFNGLSDTAKVTVNVRQPLALLLNTDTTICKGQSASLRAVASGGLPTNYVFNWTADNSNWADTSYTTLVSPDSTTTYTAILKDNCTTTPDTATIKVTIRPALKVTVNTDTTICIGQTAQLRATATGGLPANYKVIWTADNSGWTDTLFTTQNSPNTTTTYTAVLSDNCTVNPDSAKIAVTVRQPLKVLVNSDTSICQNDSVNLVATTAGGLTSNHHILWKENTTAWTDTNFTITVTPNQSKTYTAILTDNCTTIADSAKVTVTLLPPLTVAVTAKDSICTGQTITLTATPSGGKAASYNLQWVATAGSWISSNNPATDTPLVNTTYIVTLTDNCSQPAIDSITITVLPNPVADFSIDTTAGCPPLLVTFTDVSINNDTAQNTWRMQTADAFGVTNYTRELLVAGTYGMSLTVSNALGCTDAITKPNAITVFDKPTADFIVKPDIKEVEQELLIINQSQRANKYMWDFGEGTTLIQNTKADTSFKYKDSGYYNVLLIAENANGCKDTATQLLHLVNRLYCYIPNAFTPSNNDNLNPVFEPSCIGVRKYTLTIYNRWGQVIHHCENCSWDGTYMDKPVPSEIYMYQLQIIAQTGRKETVFGVVNVLW
jgi:gliding motility-associated-like protein